MTFASRSGEFATVTGNVGLLDPTTFLVPLYSSTNPLLFTAIPGDGNLKGEVGAADYTVWANGFGPGTVFTTGDDNGDGALAMGALSDRQLPFLRSTQTGLIRRRVADRGSSACRYISSVA